MRPVMPQARAISSMTSTTSSSGRPPPPYAAGTVMPMNPAAARSFTLSHGYSSLASHRAARSANVRSASSRARCRNSNCSALSSKSMPEVYAKTAAGVVPHCRRRLPLDRRLRAPALPAQSLSWGRHGGARRRRATTVGRGAKPPSESLYMDRVAEGGHRGLERGLRERRMRVDRVHDLVDRRLERAADGELVDHLRRLGADDVRA